jgi:hypothetical protein
MGRCSRNLKLRKQLKLHLTIEKNKNMCADGSTFAATLNSRT